MKNNLIIAVIISLIVGGAGGFFGGMQYQKSQTPSFGNRQFGFRQFGAGQGVGRNGGGARPVVGQIISSDDKSITVKMQDGSSKIVLISDKTSINKASTGTMADLKTGENIVVFGTQNSDGSLSALNVQLNPQMRFFGRPTGQPAQ